MAFVAQVEWNTALKLAFVIPTWTRLGGTEGYAQNLAADLAKRGHSIDILCRRSDSHAPGLAGVTVRVIGAGPWRGQLAHLAFEMALKKYPLNAYDAVLGLGRTAHHDVFRAGGGAHARWLALRRDPWLKRIFLTNTLADRVELARDERALHAARLVICNSEMAADDIVTYYGLSRDPIRVVRNGVDATRFAPNPVARAETRARWGVPDGGRVALALGRGFFRKGLLHAADAFQIAACAQDRLVIAGDHDARSLRKMKKKLGHQLIVLGLTRTPEVALAAADATLLPTFYDAAANTTLEALASGVPPVTTARDGNAEIVPDPRLVVREPSDVAGLAAALRYAWEAGLGAQCRATALEWPVSRNAVAVDAILREVRHGS